MPTSGSVDSAGTRAFVAGVLSLHDFPRKRALATGRRRLERIDPAVNFQGGDHGLGPADFAVQYGVESLHASGIDGRGVSIAVIGRTDIKLSDVQAFRSFFGLPANDPVFVHNGPDPGNLGSGGSTDGNLEESEADLDVEWTGARATPRQPSSRNPPGRLTASTCRRSTPSIATSPHSRRASAPANGT
jgi:hypothetical protein